MSRVPRGTEFEFSLRPVLLSVFPVGADAESLFNEIPACNSVSESDFQVNWSATHSPQKYEDKKKA